MIYVFFVLFFCTLDPYTAFFSTVSGFLVAKSGFLAKNAIDSLYRCHFTTNYQNWVFGGGGTDDDDDDDTPPEDGSMGPRDDTPKEAARRAWLCVPQQKSVENGTKCEDVWAGKKKQKCSFGGICACTHTHTYIYIYILGGAFYILGWSNSTSSFSLSMSVQNRSDRSAKLTRTDLV